MLGSIYPSMPIRIYWVVYPEDAKKEEALFIFSEHDVTHSCSRRAPEMCHRMKCPKAFLTGGKATPDPTRIDKPFLIVCCTKTIERLFLFVKKVFRVVFWLLFYAKTKNILLSQKSKQTLFRRI